MALALSRERVTSVPYAVLVYMSTPPRHWLGSVYQHINLHPLYSERLFSTFPTPPIWFVLYYYSPNKMAEELSKPGLVEALGAGSGVLVAYDGAWRATEEDKRDDVHPIRCVCVVSIKVLTISRGALLPQLPQE